MQRTIYQVTAENKRTGERELLRDFDSRRQAEQLIQKYFTGRTALRSPFREYKNPRIKENDYYELWSVLDEQTGDVLMTGKNQETKSDVMKEVVELLKVDAPAEIPEDVLSNMSDEELLSYYEYRVVQNKDLEEEY